MPLLADAPPDAVSPAALPSSYLILLALAGLVLVAYLLFYFGVVTAVVRAVSTLIHGLIRTGLRVWEAVFSAGSWPQFLALVLGVIGCGVLAAPAAPLLAVACGAFAVFTGVVTCFAYMSIDLERYDVERGYKAVHNPMKGQALATYLIRYGDRVGVPLLGAAAVGVIGGFALLNYGLFESVGQTWYRMPEDRAAIGFIDFLAYSLINLYQVVDFLDLASSRGLLRITHVRQAYWLPAALLTAFKTFFTLILLQQIFASIRQGQALTAAIADFWSPHPPIQERARNSLPQHGVGVVRPLLASLRTIPAMTYEQRDQLPAVIAALGPGSIPALLDHLHDSHEGVRAVAVAALGRLHAIEALPAVARLDADPSDLVRQEVAEALGTLGGPALHSAQKRSRIPVRKATPQRRWPFRRRAALTTAHPPDLVALAVTTLRGRLADDASAVRVRAAVALGQVGPPAAAAVPALVDRLADADETVQCRAAEALGLIGDQAAISALADKLTDPSPAVKEAAARALGGFKEAAKLSMSDLIKLLKDPEEQVRQAVIATLGNIGTLDGEAAAALAEGLASSDVQTKAQMVEAVGAIGVAAEAAAPALVESLTSSSDRVRAKAAEALGKIGEAVADAAVPGLVRALRDKDTWVSAVAAEALGEMGEAAEDAVPSLVRSLRHLNPLVRAKAAEALGKMGEAAATALPALEAATRDADGAVRAAALAAIVELPADVARPLAAALAGLDDADPRVRAAAAEALGRLGAANDADAGRLLPLLEDANDQVKYQVIRTLPKLLGPTTAVIEGLCRRLLEDDSAWIQATAAQALGQLGPAAAKAGASLLRAARTGETTVREEALRAVAMVQPPQAAEALSEGMRDGSAEVRRVASAGWMRATAVPESAVPYLVEALRDPEVQVRANAAHALARLDELPPEAVPLLTDCAADPNDGLRLNAVVALRESAPAAAAALLPALIDDPNTRIRLLAAGAALAADDPPPEAAAVVRAALADSALRLRKLAVDVLASLGDRAAPFRDALRQQLDDEENAELRAAMGDVVARLESPPDAPL